MLGLDAAGKTTILYKLHIGEVLSTVPTIGKRGKREVCFFVSFSFSLLRVSTPRSHLWPSSTTTATTARLSH
jgi:hypothetical protein